MKKNKNVLFILIAVFLVGAVWSCAKTSDSEDLGEQVKIEEQSITKSLEFNEDPEFLESTEISEGEDPLEGDVVHAATEYCVGKITIVHFVKEGDEGKYKVGATICNKCDIGQTTCKARYTTRIWRRGVHVATITVVNNPLNCTACPVGGIKIE